MLSMKLHAENKSTFAIISSAVAFAPSSILSLTVKKSA
jgi:hypothetical protein